MKYVLYKIWLNDTDNVKKSLKLISYWDIVEYINTENTKLTSVPTNMWSKMDPKDINVNEFIDYIR